MRQWAPFLALFALAACGDDDVVLPDVGTSDAASDAALDAGPDAPDPVDAGDDAQDAGDDAMDAGPPCEGPPGLYEEGSCATLAEGVIAFNPRYWLWSDGTGKERYIQLPAGSVIDTTDPDNWVYPQGTRVWKTFLVGDMRVETRLFEKFDEGAGFDVWDMRTFAWNEAQDAVEEVIGGAADVLGTTHDIPDRGQCITCHAQSGRDDVLSGFTAIQLNHDDAGLTLQMLNDGGYLSTPIDVADAVIPGDETTSEALGYMHSNCGPCHGNEAARSGFNTWVDVGTATPEETPTYLTGVDVPSLRIFDTAVLRFASGDPDNSVSLTRMASREVGVQMPQIGTEVAHPEGIEIVRAWIASLPTD